jgi:large conductance mechanosensitive channel
MGRCWTYWILAREVGEVKAFFGEFRTFITRGNVVDLAVGVIIGAAFKAIVNSFVNDIVMPPIGLLLGRVNFSDLYINLSRTHYASLAEAKDAGAATINYGTFINGVIEFLLTGFILFLIIREVNKIQEMRKPKPEVPAAPTTKKCPYCFSEIAIEATRCPQCTSQLAG